MAASDNERRTEETPQFPGSCGADRDTAAAVAAAVAVAARDVVAPFDRVAANCVAVGWKGVADNATFAVGSRKREPADAFDADVVVEKGGREES